MDAFDQPHRARIQASNSAAGIGSLDEPWHGSGRPHGLSGASIPLNARIALLAIILFLPKGLWSLGEKR